MTQLKAFSYIRVSTKELQGDKFTQRTQNFLIDKYLGQQNINHLEVFEDISSGQSLDRPGLQAMLRRLPEVDQVLVQDQSRLTRDVKDLQILKLLFRESNTKIIGIQTPINYDDPYGRFIANITVSIDELERERIKIKTKAGIQRFKKEKGYWGRKPKITDRTFNYWYHTKQITNKTMLARILGVSRTTLYSYLKKKELLNA